MTSPAFKKELFTSRHDKFSSQRDIFKNLQNIKPHTTRHTIGNETPTHAGRYQNRDPRPDYNTTPLPKQQNPRNELTLRNSPKQPPRSPFLGNQNNQNKLRVNNPNLHWNEQRSPNSRPPTNNQHMHQQMEAHIPQMAKTQPLPNRREFRSPPARLGPQQTVNQDDHLRGFSNRRNKPTLQHNNPNPPLPRNLQAQNPIQSPMMSPAPNMNRANLLRNSNHPQVNNQQQQQPMMSPMMGSNRNPPPPQLNLNTQRANQGGRGMGGGSFNAGNSMVSNNTTNKLAYGNRPKNSNPNKKKGFWESLFG